MPVVCRCMLCSLTKWQAGYGKAESPRHSIDALGRRHMVHLLVQGLIDDPAVLQSHLGILDVGLVEVGEGVLHPRLVVTVWVGLVRMGTARLLPGLSAVNLLDGLVDEVFEFQGFDEVRVPNHAAVRDANILVLL